MRRFFIGLVLVIIGITLLLLIPSKQPEAPMPWEITTMPDGSIEVFDIHLGTTTYRDAQEIFRVYGKTGIFTQENKAPTVEAFFNSINLGGLSGKLVLNLAVSEEHINNMLSRATQARLQPSGAHRYELNNNDNAILIDAPITALTYIPSVQLDKEMIQHRFGKANSIEQNIDDSELWSYPTLGLTIRLNEGEKSVLLYQTINFPQHN